MRVLLVTLADAPRYAILAADIRGPGGKPLYLGGFLTEDARTKYLERFNPIPTEVVKDDG